MNIVQYVKRMTRTFSLRRVKEDLDITRDELTNHTQPIIKQLFKEEKTHPFKSKTYAYYQEEIAHQLKLRKEAAIFGLVDGVLTHSQSHLAMIEKFLDNEFHDEVTAAGLSLKKASALQLLDAITLVSRYSRRLADVVLIAENAVEQRAESEVGTLTQADTDYLKNNRPAFIHLLEVLNQPTTQVQQALEDMPELMVSEYNNNESALRVHGSDKVDPLRFGFNDSMYNPIWLILTNVAEYQTNRYHAAKQEAELLELRIQRYKRINERNPNPKLDQIIEKREEELDKLRAKIYKMEKE